MPANQALGGDIDLITDATYGKALLKVGAPADSAIQRLPLASREPIRHAFCGIQYLQPAAGEPQIRKGVNLISAVLGARPVFFEGDDVDQLPDLPARSAAWPISLVTRGIEAVILWRPGIPMTIYVPKCIPTEDLQLLSQQLLRLLSRKPAKQELSSTGAETPATATTTSETPAVGAEPPGEEDGFTIRESDDDAGDDDDDLPGA